MKSAESIFQKENRPRGYYVVSLKSIWGNGQTTEELAHFDGMLRWTRCSTGNYIDPDKIVELRGPVDVLKAPVVGE